MEVSLVIKPLGVAINAVGIRLAVLVNSHRPKTRLAVLFIAMVFLMFIWVNLLLK